MLTHLRPSRPRRRALAVGAGVATLALALTACSSGSSGSSDAKTQDPNEKITLTVATFNNFGYTQDLLDEYTKAHPNVTIKQTIAATSDDAKNNFTTKLAAGGAGLADVQAVDVDWMPIVLQYENKFTDLTDDSLKDRWLQWKTAQATAPDGKLLGYGTDIGPEAICYRQDLFAKYGLPSDPDKVAELLGGADSTWDKYFSVGEDFVQKSGGKVAWYDSSEGTYQAMVGQIANPYEESTGTPKDLATNQTIKDLFTKVATESKDKGLSAHNQEWSDDWSKSFQNDAFATMACPPWMTGSIEDNAGGVKGWNVANVFPGGGGNWGGSFLVVPAAGKHTAAAKEFAAWLTAPDQQVGAFKEAGNYPSQVDAEVSDTVSSSTNDFFNNAPVGKIFADRAKAVTVTPFKGQNYFTINKAVTDALVAYDVQGKGTVDSNWNAAVDAYKALGLG
ncbi:extracellular solute-binding protein [Luteimicrobium subarcticum]|uniref:Cellobiose-binding protein n=1 Tax=Luteimicrobium subarcticum TaxID=620910 RepID=A0A2M8WTE1_9MICO|nr:extracellular solute-binding protein [Luteimicrobium subarcticum]PJI94220.1 cellobiose-binding protein [Luteimicrobium subarcticum]